MQKFEYLCQPLLGELAMSRKKKRERRKRKKRHLKWPPTFMPAAKGSARTLLGPKVKKNNTLLKYTPLRMILTVSLHKEKEIRHNGTYFAFQNIATLGR